MEFKTGKIEGVVIEKLVKFFDERGFLVETFRVDNLPDNLCPVMSHISYTKPGVARGPHKHNKQTDIFCFLGPGNFKIKLWDNREESKTYGNYMQFFGGKEKPIRVIIPFGVVHGYKNISKDEIGMVINYPDKLYRGWGKKGSVDEKRYENDKRSPFNMND